jgi:uncharacterized protein YggT (Ycf19 family)
MSNLDDRAPAREPERREVRRETVVDTTGAAVPEVDVYQERVSGPTGDQVVRSEHVSVPSEATRRAAEAARIKQVIYFIFGVINALLALRFVLLLLGANEASPFVSFIYTLSQPFTAPFQGIFNEPTFGGSVVEWASLVAIIVYMLISYGLARLVELMYAPARPDTTRNV